MTLVKSLSTFCLGSARTPVRVCLHPTQQVLRPPLKRKMNSKHSTGPHFRCGHCSPNVQFIWFSPLAQNMYSNFTWLIQLKRQMNIYLCASRKVPSKFNRKSPIDGSMYLSGRAMAQAVSRRPLTTEARGSVPGQVHVRFVVDKVALGQVFLRVVGFPLSISFHWCIP
jgi:hypothetical protein